MTNPRPPPDESGVDAKGGIRWDALAAIIASLVGLLALIVAGYTAYIEREQVRAQVWPYLLMTKVNDNGHYELDADNRGVGPVIVKSLQMAVGGESLPNWRALFSRIGFKPSGAWEQDSLNGTVISPDGEVRWIRFHDRADFDAFIYDWDQHHVVARVCYSSTLGESWVVVISNKASLTPRSVSGCPKISKQNQFHD